MDYSVNLNLDTPTQAIARRSAWPSLFLLDELEFVLWIDGK